MNVSDITIEQFKAQYPNGINGYQYLPSWESTIAYNINDIVFLNNVFYQCILSNTNQSPPNVTYWVVVTGYNYNVNLYISNSQITNAMLQAQLQYPSNLTCRWKDNQIIYAYCMLVAHFLLAYSIPQALAFQGQATSSIGSIDSQSVGNVSLHKEIPQAITKSIFLSGLNTTAYGQQYMQLIQPLTIGFMGYVFGGIAD